MSDNDMGYKIPPKSTQFQRGKSGNPHGRPKGSSHFKTDLAAEMRERILLRDKNGRSYETTKQRALIQMLVTSALQNEKSAVTAVLALIKHFAGETEEPSPQAPDLEDIAMIKGYLKRTEARLQHENNSSDQNQPQAKRENQKSE